MAAKSEILGGNPNRILVATATHNLHLEIGIAATYLHIPRFLVNHFNKKMHNIK